MYDGKSENITHPPIGNDKDRVPQNLRNDKKWEFTCDKWDTHYISDNLEQQFYHSLWSFNKSDKGQHLQCLGWYLEFEEEKIFQFLPKKVRKAMKPEVI